MTECDSYEDLEAKVWKLEHENEKLKELNDRLKQELKQADTDYTEACQDATHEAQVNMELTAQIDVLREALEKAKDGVENWGTYADKYFQDKWNLQGDIAAIDKALSTTNDKAEKMLKVVRAAEMVVDIPTTKFISDGNWKNFCDAVKAYKDNNN